MCPAPAESKRQKGGSSSTESPRGCRADNLGAFPPSWLKSQISPTMSFQSSLCAMWIDNQCLNTMIQFLFQNMPCCVRFLPSRNCFKHEEISAEQTAAIRSYTSFCRLISMVCRFQLYHSPSLEDIWNPQLCTRVSIGEY